MTLIQGINAYLPGYAVNVLRLLFWLVLLSILFVPLERLLAVRAGSPGRAERLHDVGYYFVNSLLPALVLSTPLAMLAVGAQHLVPPALQATLGALPFAARLTLSFLIVEFGFYWGHRLSHGVPALWRFHAVHHSPEHLYFLVHTRAHPVDLIFTRLCGLAPLYALGLASPSADGSATPVALILTAAVWGFFLHSNLRIRLGPLEWLIATPAFHHWHHSRSVHLNHNFAATLPLLDRLFGTLHLPRAWPPGYGIDSSQQP